MSGGFAYLPAFSKPLMIDTALINAQVANQLETLVRNARFFEQPVQSGVTTKGAADYVKYTITVEDGSQIHTIQLTDAVTDANLRELVSQLRIMAHPSRL